MSPVNRNASPYELRDYQEYTVAAHRAAHLGRRRPTGEGIVNATVSTLATGMGKTVIAGECIGQALGRMERAVFLTHRRDLAHQTRKSLHSQLPGASIGLVMGAEHNGWEADVVVMSVPSVGSERQMRRRRIPAGRYGLGVADEVHHSAADTWQYALDYLGINRGMPWIGLTATLARGDSKSLGDTWKEIVADYDIGYGVRNGWLVRPKGIRLRVKDLMLDQVRRSRGDFVDDDLADAMEDADAGQAMAQAYLAKMAGRRTAAFAPNQHSARMFAEDFNAAGISTEVVVDGTSDAERAAIYERFRLGTTLVIWSVGVLTEGWDASWCDGIIMAAMTSSTVKYIQCVGRGLRLWKPGGKVDCIVLDVVGVSAKHRLVSLKDLAGKTDGREGFSIDYEDPDEPTEPGQYAPEVRRTVDGELVAEDVDLFGDSESNWLQTPEGIWFVPTRSSYWFLAAPPRENGFRLGRIPAAGGRAHWVEKELGLEAGMAWAMKYATDEDSTVSSRNAPWRKAKPSQRMLVKAAECGVPADGLRQGELSDVITVATASHVLRKYAVAR